MCFRNLNVRFKIKIQENINDLVKFCQVSKVNFFEFVGQCLLVIRSRKTC